MDAEALRRDGLQPHLPPSVRFAVHRSRHNATFQMTPADLLRNNVPLIDLRSPGEFVRGAFPTACNLPLLSEAERSEIGTLYKQRGSEAAVRRGHELVSGVVRTTRMQAWTDFLRRHPDAWIYCWRGGMRSAIVQSWLREVGWAVPRVAGGYKRLRQTCLDLFADLETTVKRAEPAAAPEPVDGKRWLVLAGRTGVGKTEVIKTLPNAIDLEGLARHRGSAFGSQEHPQPPPIAFENAVAAEYLQHRTPTLILEDESRTIGRLALPKPWYARMQQAPIALLEASLAQRITQIRKEYVDAPLSQGTHGAALQARHQTALDRIAKRLGHQRHEEVSKALASGFQNGKHERWIGLLLTCYYDPMYDHQLSAKKHRVIFAGDRQTVTEYLNVQ